MSKAQLMSKFKGSIKIILSASKYFLPLNVKVS